MEAAIVGSDTFGRVQSGIPTHRRPRQQLFRGCYGCYTRTANKLTPTPGSSSLVQSPRISGNHNLLTGKCIGNVQGVQTHILGQTAPHSAPNSHVQEVLQRLLRFRDSNTRTQGVQDSYMYHLPAPTLHIPRITAQLCNRDRGVDNYVCRLGAMFIFRIFRAIHRAPIHNIHQGRSK